MVMRLGPAARSAGLPHATAQAALASASRRKVIDGPFGQARLSRTMPDMRLNSSRLALGYSRPTRFHNQASRIVRFRRSDSSHIRSEEHTSELQSPYDLVCRLLLEKKKRKSQACHEQ